MKQLQQYTYTIPAGGAVMIPATNDNFIVQASTGPLSIRGDTFGTLRGLVAGQGLKAVPFGRLELVDESGAPNTVQLLMTPAEFVNQVFSGSVNVVGALSLDTATMATLRQPLQPTGTANLTAALVANTAQQIVAPGSNPNGLIVLQGGFFMLNSGAGIYGNILAKASAPASITDGEIVVPGLPFPNGANLSCNAELKVPQYVAAGLGLYVIAQQASTLHHTHARWRAL